MTEIPQFRRDDYRKRVKLNRIMCCAKDITRLKRFILTVAALPRQFVSIA
jgi:hypothetical protein